MRIARVVVCYFVIIASFTGVATAAPQGPTPVWVYIECDSVGGIVPQPPVRTPVCPTLLRGILDAEPLLEYMPRRHADVIVYVHTTQAGAVDVVSFTVTRASRMEGAPDRFEIEQSIDPRAPVDDQIDALAAGLRKAIAPWILAKHPRLVAISLLPAPPSPARDEGSPWDFDVSLRAHTSRFQSLSNTELQAELGVARTTNDDMFGVRFGTRIHHSTIRTSDDEEVDWWLNAFAGELTSERRIVAGLWGGGRLAATRTETIEGTWDAAHGYGQLTYRFFEPNDPRGNRLDAGVGAGAAGTRTEIAGVVEEAELAFVYNAAVAGSIRLDGTFLGLHGGVASDLGGLDAGPVVFGSLDVSVVLSPHVDLLSWVSATHWLDSADEPSWGAGVGVRFHWDRTNRARDLRPLVW